MGCEQSVPVVNYTEMYKAVRPQEETDAKHGQPVTEPSVADSEDTAPASKSHRSSSASAICSASAPSSSEASKRRASRLQTLESLQYDEAITMARIDRDKLVVGEMLSRGGYGEVYVGNFRGRRVAVKMLLPETRKSAHHVSALLAEVKFMASMEHPHIVRFIGVAWDSLADLCVVSELMEGGDLRALMVSYDEQGHPVGFDESKMIIALHVAHALTYLHSLMPAVLHRDLKSKNILLSRELEAKVADFGVSRERANHTMTAGVGSSLWMAPEVLLGGKYDEKADIFAFGVVLSELDLHTLPYSHAKENSDSGRQVPETAILQMMLLGRLRVEFSQPAVPGSITALGEICVSKDPAARPTASQALYQLQKILAQERQEIARRESDVSATPSYAESETSDTFVL